MHDESTSPTESTPESGPPDERSGRHSASSAESILGAPPMSQWHDASDSDLILYTRAGDGAAYGELWRRHARAGRTVARSFTSSLDPDDLVQESFAKIYQALQKGGGPTGAFRPYLFTTIRNTASAWGRARRESSIDTLESFEDPASRDEETMAALDRGLTATAFRSLPTRWQEVLWYCEVEQMTPQQVAPLLAMKPNAVAALAYRAREGLRQAWIQAHIAAVPEDSEHRWTIERIGSYTRGSLGKRDTTKIEAHLDECARCTIVAAEAKEVGSRIALVLLPLAAGTAGATGYLAWMQTGSHAALTTAAMPAAVIGGHGMSLGTTIDPSVLTSLSAHGSTTTAGATASGTAASGTAVSGSAVSGSAVSGTAVSGTMPAAGGAAGGAATTAAGTGVAAATATGAVSASVVTTGIVSGAIALVAAGAVAAAIAFSPGVVTPVPLASESSQTTTEADAAPSIPPPTSPEDATPEPASPGASTVSPGTGATPADPVAPATTPTAGGTPPPVDPVPVDPTPVEPVDPPDPQNPTDPETPEQPGAPTVSAADSGPSEQFYPVLSGTAEPGAMVSVRRGDQLLSEVTSDTAGAWTTPPLTAVPAGTSALEVTQTTANGTSTVSTVTTRLRDAPRITSPMDGGFMTPFDTTLTLAPGAPGSLVAGSVDGQPMFTCTYDAEGVTSTCDWIPGTDWLLIGFGLHTISVAHSDGQGRLGPSSSISITVGLLPGAAVAPEPAAAAAPADTGAAAPSDLAEPDTAEPVPTEPVAPEPNAPEPNAPEPSTPELNATELSTPEPNATEPSTPEPSTPEPNTPELSAKEPDVAVAEPVA